MSEKKIIKETVITVQICDILKKLYGSLNNFEIISLENDIKIVRNSDSKELLLSYQKHISEIEKIIKSEFDSIDDISQDIPRDTNNNSWIIKFKDGVDVKKMMTKMRSSSNIKMNHIYDSEVFNGMNCICSADEIESLSNMFDGMVHIEADQKVEIAALKERSIVQSPAGRVGILSQILEPFVTRIGANRSSQKSGNGSGTLASKTNINVFIVDTGISRHSELNIVGGRNFTSTLSTDWIDRNGHGTHVAGIVGGLDNTVGSVGIAPGVRLWAVKVLGDDGSGYTSDIIAGLNWILSNRNKLWSGIGIINMSMGGDVNSPFDVAVNNIINNGLITVVAAGNSSANAVNSSPARVANAITVGATGPKSSYNALASFSNFGSGVDIVAPGTTILSTYLDGQFAYLSGTSMASPVVTGTIALMLSRNTILGGNTLTFVKNVRSKLVIDSSVLKPEFFDGTIGSNPRISVPSTKPTTNISVWAGSF